MKFGLAQTRYQQQASDKRNFCKNLASTSGTACTRGSPRPPAAAASAGSASTAAAAKASASARASSSSPAVPAPHSAASSRQGARRRLRHAAPLPVSAVECLGDAAAEAAEGLVGYDDAAGRIHAVIAVRAS